MALTQVPIELSSTPGIVDNSNATAITIDSSENVLVGTTSTAVGVGNTNTGLSLRNDGFAAISRTGTSGQPTLVVNKNTNDGELVGFYKAGSAVGNISTIGGDFVIGSTSGSDAAFRMDGTNNQIYPSNATGSARDNAVNLGASTVRWKDLYLSGQTFGGDGAANAPTYAFGNDTNMGMYRAENNILAFCTSSAERMRITGPDLLVGRTSAGTTGNGHTIRGDDSVIFSRDSSGESMIVARNASAGNLVRFYCNGVDKGSIDFDGSNTISYTSSSDQRLKENIADADDAGSKVDAIQVRKFDWIADGSHQDYGMVAQELQTVAPEAVSGDADSDEIMGVDYSKLVPMLVKEIQSLRARVAQLENN